VSGVMSPAVSGSKSGGDTMVVVGTGGAADGALAAAAAAAAVELRPGVGSGGLYVCGCMVCASVSVSFD
jgi:hypothetical protein